MLSRSSYSKDRERAIYENPLNDFCTFIAAIEEPLPCDIKLEGFFPLIFAVFSSS
jgi:hypothetical protein